MRFKIKSHEFNNLFTLTLIATALTGCASPTPKYSNSDYSDGNKYCSNQSNADKVARNPKWFSLWLACMHERIMPIEIYLYPDKEGEIKEMYTKLFVLAKDVDSGKSLVEPVYAEWDRMMDEIKMAPCTMKMVGKDGSEKCLSH